MPDSPLMQEDKPIIDSLKAVGLVNITMQWDSGIVKLTVGSEKGSYEEQWSDESLQEHVHNSDELIANRIKKYIHFLSEIKPCTSCHCTNEIEPCPAPPASK